MVNAQLTSLKKQINNIIILILGIWVLLPYTPMPSTVSHPDIAAAIVFFCVGYIALRFTIHSLPSAFLQQNTQHLWALHTASRLQKVKKEDDCQFWSTWGQRKFFLVVGNKQSGKSTLLSQTKAIEKQLPFEYQKKGLITHSVWTEQNNILLETTCLMPYNHETNRILKGYWRDLSRICKWQNTCQGFNGIVLVLSLQSILSEKQSHPTQSIDALRCQLKNICHASPHTPIHLVVTGIDQIEGFYTFFKYIDKDDVQKPLGFILPPAQQYNGDIQGELDKVANDIEMYLIYMLEKVIQGAQNDVEKMHIFHESFKALKPRIVQILYSLKTQIANPVSSIFFTSFNNQETPIATSEPQHAYHSDLHKSYFSENVLKTIAESIHWQPSKKHQQYALLMLALIAWPQSQISMSDHFISPIQKQLELFFDATKTTEKTTIIRTNVTPKPIKKEISIINPTDIPTQTTSKNKNVIPVVLKESLWDNLKPNIDAKVNQCHLFKNRSCLNLSLLLSHLQTHKKLTQRTLNEFNKLIDFPATSKLSQDEHVYHLTDDNNIEVNFFLKKLQKPLQTTSDYSIARDLISLIDSNYQEYNLEKRIAQSKPIITKACDIMQNLSPALPASLPKNKDTCQTWLNRQMISRDIHQHLKQIEKNLDHYHQSPSFEDFFRKVQYLKDNSNTVTQSIQKMQQDLSHFEPYMSAMDTSTQHHFQGLSQKLEQFNSQNYNKTLVYIYNEGKEIIQSKQQGLAALQALEMMLDQKSTIAQETDQLSRNCIETYEKMTIKMAGQYLNDMWINMILTPYAGMKDLYPFNVNSTKHVNIEDFHEFFSPQGHILSFYNKYLHNITVMEPGSGARWKTLHGKNLPFDKTMTSFIMAANIVQKMYYPNQSQEPWFEGILRYRHASKNIKRIHIIQDHSQQTINPQQTAPIHIKWPHAQDKFAVSVLLNNGETVVLAQENGPWSMINFLDKATKGSTSKKNRILKFSHYENTVELEFESQNNVTPLSATLDSFFQLPTAIYHAPKL